MLLLIDNGLTLIAKKDVDVLTFVDYCFKLPLDNCERFFFKDMKSLTEPSMRTRKTEFRCMTQWVENAKAITTITNNMFAWKYENFASTN